MTETIKLGSKIPSFELDATLVDKCTDSDFKNQWTILFLYPKDNTSGCTTEVQDFNNLNQEFNSYGVKIYGLSKDTLKSHQSFSNKQLLKFPLISDPDTELIARLFCWVEKSMYGKKYMGTERTTFLINSDCEIRYIWNKVKVKDHAKEVLDMVIKHC
jgi:peroxiredoxin Q/BCP